jgi:Tfp pilus assembly protein PilF
MYGSFCERFGQKSRPHTSTRKKRRMVRSAGVRAFGTLVLVSAVALLSSEPLTAQGRRISGTDQSMDWMTLQGTVVEQANNSPVSGVRVTITSTTGGVGAQTSYTDSEGRFRAQVVPATYNIRVEATGFESSEETVSAQGAEAPVVVAIRREPASAESAEAFVSAKDLKVPEKALKALRRGVESLDKKQPEKAEGQFREALAMYPDYPEAHYRLGLALMSLGDIAHAEASLQRAIELTDGHNAPAQFAMGALLCQQRRFAEALRSLERGEAVDPASFQGPLFQGQALLGLGRLEEAEKQEIEALQRRAEVPLAYLILSNIHIAMHRYPQLVNDLDRFLRLQPTGPTSDAARHTRELALQQIAESSAQKMPIANNP